VLGGLPQRCDLCQNGGIGDTCVVGQQQHLADDLAADRLGEALGGDGTAGNRGHRMCGHWDADWPYLDDLRACALKSCRQDGRHRDSAANVVISTTQSRLTHWFCKIGGLLHRNVREL
jgi:hypothetical protein